MARPLRCWSRRLSPQPARSAAADCVPRLGARPPTSPRGRPLNGILERSRESRTRRTRSMLIRLLLAVCCLAVLSLGSPLLPLASQATAARPALSSYLQEPDGLPAAVAAEAPTPYPDCPLGTTT